jgi:hypothetical protein
MSKKPPKKDQKKHQLPPLHCKVDAVKLLINHIVRNLEESKANSASGKIPYGLIGKCVKEIQPLCPWITRGMVKHHLKKLNTSREVFSSLSGHGEGNHGSASTMLLGSLSKLTVSTTMGSSFDSIGNEAVADKAEFLTMHHPTAPAATRNEAVADEAELDAEFTTMNCPAVTAPFGRPKGTTNTSTHDFKKRVKLARRRRHKSTSV